MAWKKQLISMYFSKSRQRAKKTKRKEEKGFTYK
jgi:hypothetical protein